ERRAARTGQRAGAQMGVVDSAVGRLHDPAMSGPLQRGLRRLLGGKEMHVRMTLVWTLDAARARHGHGMVVARSTFRHGEVVPAVLREKMRGLHEAKRTAAENVPHRAYQPAGPGVEFLQQDARKGWM